MSTVGEVTEGIINRSPFLREAITENLINISALARRIQPEIEESLDKKIKSGAIIMAIKRMSPKQYQHVEVKMKNIIASLGDFIIRHDLQDFTYKNSSTLALQQLELQKFLVNQEEYFYTFCHGVGESTVIASKSLSSKILEVFKKEEMKTHTKNLSSITIKLPPINTKIEGIYYYLLKYLAWEGINITNVVSTAHEITVVVKEENIDLAFSVLMQLKKSFKDS